MRLLFAFEQILCQRYIDAELCYLNICFVRQFVQIAHFIVRCSGQIITYLRWNRCFLLVGVWIAFYLSAGVDVHNDRVAVSGIRETMLLGEIGQVCFLRCYRGIDNGLAVFLHFDASDE